MRRPLAASIVLKFMTSVFMVTAQWWEGKHFRLNKKTNFWLLTIDSSFVLSTKSTYDPKLETCNLFFTIDYERLARQFPSTARVKINDFIFSHQQNSNMNMLYSSNKIKNEIETKPTQTPSFHLTQIATSFINKQKSTHLLQILHEGRFYLQ